MAGRREQQLGRRGVAMEGAGGLAGRRRGATWTKRPRGSVQIAREERGEREEGGDAGGSGRGGAARGGRDAGVRATALEEERGEEKGIEQSCAGSGRARVGEGVRWAGP